MSDDKQSILGGLKANLATITAIIAIVGMIGSVAVTYDKVGELVDDAEKINAGQTEAHDDIDILKIRIVQELYDSKIENINERHELEIEINSKIHNEKVERLESQLEYYKNK